VPGGREGVREGRACHKTGMTVMFTLQRTRVSCNRLSPDSNRDSVNKPQELNSGAKQVDSSKVDVVVAPTAVHLGQVKSTLGSPYELSSQDVWIKGPGAYTGEVPAEILKDLGVGWTLTGHSERRAYCGETNEVVGQKTARALEAGLSVIPCIGESLEQRNSGQLFPVLSAQVQALVDNIQDWSRIVVAYEPVWAIGTGVVATPEQAQEVHAYLRK